MHIVNATKMAVQYTMGTDPDGREHFVVVVKGTFHLPIDGSIPDLMEEQEEHVLADAFTGEPAFSATAYESEFALFKPRCDVILNGSVYAASRPVTKATAALSFDGRVKRIEVVGDRVWERGLLGYRPSAPIPFEQKEITYDVAYGGMDVHPDKPKRSKAYDLNPVGVGFYPVSGGRLLDGKPLANTTKPGVDAKSCRGKYKPMSFGTIGRNFAPRPKLAGTYDETWLEEVFPFLPRDFDPLYYQCAPEDQQFAHPTGGERIVLEGLVADRPRVEFELPKIDVPVEFTSETMQRTRTSARLDTVVIEPDRGRFLLLWRTSHPMRRSTLEIAQCVIGRMPNGWYRARDTGKTYYASLAQLSNARREAARKGGQR